MSFVHLHVHSQYSLLEATCQFKPLIQLAQKYEMPALALTDNGNMFGAIEFYFAAKESGLNPILGLEVYLAPKSRFIKGEAREIQTLPNRRLVLLATSFKGYQNLCRISTAGYHEGFYYRPRIDDEVLRQYHEDLIVLSGGTHGDIPLTLLHHGEEEALKRIRTLKEIFDDRFYLELNRNNLSIWDKINPFLKEASRITGVPTVVANDVHYLRQEEQIAQEVLICIGTNKTLHDESRYRLGSDQFYFKSPEQMRNLFKDDLDSCERTLEIAHRCQIKFNLKDEQGRPKYHLPTYPTGGRSLQDEIKVQAESGLERRFSEAQERGEQITDQSIYRTRLNYELQVIQRMGFNGYFLIVADFIGWAKSKNIPVGPGRGSGAGSLVAYSLGITDLDPMPYNLVFERFLNPERISMPDFDVDFCQEKRQQVIDYVTQKYGQQSVAQIITYGKLQARAAVRDVGRVLGMTYGEVDVVAKLIPEKLGITLSEAIETEPRLRELMDTDPKVSSLMDLAQKIEGLVRHAGIHAAGVIIADGNILDWAPLYRGSEGEVVVQYDMKHAEKIGLIKFDFLGLKTLTHIQDAIELISQNRKKNISTKDISLQDSGIYQIMCQGDTGGIFQFESEGITDLIRKAKPNCFEDIVALNALYRPGPMDMIPSYLERKHGEIQPDYIFESLEPILKETFGIIVYQEQVQLVAAKVANYSLGEADLLRRAMGKKNPEEMAKQKSRFLQGALQNNYDLKKAEDLFEKMAEFANYGFNKSHAAAYCVVAAFTAWLKNYYPVEFYAALLSTEMSDTDDVVKYVREAQQHQIVINAPHINHSDYKFSVRQSQIYFALGAIKGVGESAVQSILESRGQQPNQCFASLEDFFTQVDLRRVNKKTIECLIKAGALDGFGFNRNELMLGYGQFIDSALRKKQEKSRGQVSLFTFLDDQENDFEKVILATHADWPRSYRLAAEKEVLGFYLSDHPLSGLSVLAKTWTNASLDKLKNLPTKSKVHLLGVITGLKEIITKKGTRMAFASLEDLVSQVELVVFPNTYAEIEMILKSESPLILSGQLEVEEGGVKILVDKARRLNDVLQQAKKIEICLDEKMESHLQNLKDTLLRNSGDSPVSFRVDLADLSVHMELMEPLGVRPSLEFIEEIHKEFGRFDFINIG
ncbi:MAG: DNA polymerase III subunit alpha [Bdellovibrionales bacterium]|nr:DNA polymerase III subunit alpha [Bdellovibrionales bacterium]